MVKIIKPATIAYKPVSYVRIKDMLEANYYAPSIDFDAVYTGQIPSTGKVNIFRADLGKPRGS
jgi:hypothetical protein